MASISIPAASPPPPPARSPLRPAPISRTPTSASSFSNQQDSKRNSFPSLSSMLDALTPVTVSLATDDSKSHKTMSSSSSSLPYTPNKPAPMTKRYHALHELLSSERAYASDLALIREVHIPLALGEYIFHIWGARYDLSGCLAPIFQLRSSWNALRSMIGAQARPYTLY